MKIYTTILSAVALAISINVRADTVAQFVLPSGVTVRIVEAAFTRAEFKVQGCVNDATVCLINGHVPMGTALTLPKTYVKEIVVTYRGVSHSLDGSNMFDAWGKRPLEYRGAIRYFGGNCYDSQNCQFRGLFSDAGGSFVAEWRVENGVATRTVLTDSSDVMNLFMKNIDPPTYE